MSLPDAPTIIERLSCGRAGCRPCVAAVSKGHGNVHCPAHADDTPSFSVNVGRRQAVVVSCQTGCEQDAVIAALRERGLWPDRSERCNGRERLRRPKRPNAERVARARGGTFRKSLEDSNSPDFEPPDEPPTFEWEGDAEGSEPFESPFEHLSNTDSNGAQDGPATSGLTIPAYCAARRFDEAFIRSCGVEERFTQDGRAWLQIPYPQPDQPRKKWPVRLRHALEKGPNGDERFTWRKGSKPTLYGLDRLDAARRSGAAALVEGESDSHAAWLHDVPAVGVPGAGMWREERDAGHLDGITTIYAVVEPDQGGSTLVAKLSRSKIADRVRLVRLPDGIKDLCDLHVDDPERFTERWQRACEASVPLTEAERCERERRAAEAERLAAPLLDDPKLLDRIGEIMRAGGYAGSLREPKTVYLGGTSRLLERPAAVAVVAPSAAGKNAVTDAALALMPSEAFYAISAASPRALVYAAEDFQHRIVFYREADSVPDDGPAASAIRALVADNRLEYDTTERDPDGGGFRHRRIVKPGPTGFLTTSTKSLAHQLGTRVLEIAVRDDAKQTRTVLHAHADRVTGAPADPPDLAPLHAVQTWLSLAGERRVLVPFAHTLADLVPADLVRWRRDFRQLLTFIQAHALLHQRQRPRDSSGAVVATLDDYAAVRELLAPTLDAIAAGGVTQVIRETVENVAEDETISAAALASRLEISPPTLTWRLRRALAGGWLVNDEDRKGRPAKLRRGAPLPEARPSLPTVACVREVFESPFEWGSTAHSNTSEGMGEGSHSEGDGPPDGEKSGLFESSSQSRKVPPRARTRANDRVNGAAVSADGVEIITLEI